MTERGSRKTYVPFSPDDAVAIRQMVATPDTRTELRNAPLKDLCELGGWKDPNTILKCYQRADEAAMRTALAKRQAI